MGGSYLHMIRDIISKESPLAFYKGMGSPLISMPLLNSVVFSSYSLALSQLNLLSSTSSFSTDTKIILASMFAGFLNSFVAGPNELFKTKLQIQKDGVNLYKGNFDLAKKLYRTSGFRGFFQGLNLTITRDIFSYAAQFYTYHIFMKYFMKMNNTKYLSLIHI